MKLNFEKPPVPKSLDELFADDPFGLFADVQPKKAALPSDPLSQRFAEILDFVEKYGREPTNEGELNEKVLARSLAKIRQDDEFCKKLAEFDRLHLLSPPPTPLQAVENTEKNAEDLPSLDDILNNDVFGLLDMGDSSILDLQHITPQPQKAINGYEGEETGKRSICQDFERFKPIFRQLHSLLANKKLVAQTEVSEKVEKGDLFILQGMFCFVVEKQFEERRSQKENYRLRVIFENGTQSNMLARSLSRAVQKDETGKRLMFVQESDYQAYREQLFGKLSGYIYVAKLSQPKAELAEYPNLYKIGFTGSTVEERLKGCEDDIAFLESRVEKVMSFTCFNCDPHKLESLLHGFLAPRKLQLSLVGKNGQIYQPQEWFDIPLETVQQAVLRILDGTIGGCRLDRLSGKLVTIE